MGIDTTFEKFRNMSATLSKSAAHATDSELAQEGEAHPDAEVDEEVDQVGDAGVDGTKPDRSKPEEGAAQPPQETSSLAEGSSDGIGGSHPTEKELKDQSAPSGQSQSAKTAGAIQGIQESAQGLEQSEQKVLKSAQALLNAFGVEDDDTAASAKKSAADEEESEDAPPESALEDAQTEEEERREEEEEKDEAKMAREAGEGCCDLFARGVDAVTEQEKQAALGEELAACYQYGYEECGMKVAQALDNEAAMNLQAMEGGMEGGPGEMPPAGPAAMPGAPPGAGEGAGGSIQELAALIEMLMNGKEPETPEEEQIATILRDQGLLPEGADAGEEAPPKKQKPEASGDDDEEQEDGQSMEEDMPPGGLKAAMASMDIDDPKFQKFYKMASAEAQAAVMMSLREGEKV